jgi:hypothetical protein
MNKPLQVPCGVKLNHKGVSVSEWSALVQGMTNNQPAILQE